MFSLYFCRAVRVDCPVFICRHTVKEEKRKSRLPFQVNGLTFGGALSATVEPLGRHIVAAVRALQTKKRRHFGTLQPLLVCFFQLIFV